MNRDWVQKIGWGGRVDLQVNWCDLRGPSMEAGKERERWTSEKLPYRRAAAHRPGSSTLGFLGKCGFKGQPGVSSWPSDNFKEGKGFSNGTRCSQPLCIPGLCIICGFNQLQIENVWGTIASVLTRYRHLSSSLFPNQYSIGSIYTFLIL